MAFPDAFDLAYIVKKIEINPQSKNLVNNDDRQSFFNLCPYTCTLPYWNSFKERPLDFERFASSMQS